MEGNKSESHIGYCMTGHVKSLKRNNDVSTSTIKPTVVLILKQKLNSEGKTNKTQERNTILNKS